MKQVEHFLCAQCWQDVMAAGLKIEEAQKGKTERRTCTWCGRSCYGQIYRITYGRDTK